MSEKADRLKTTPLHPEFGVEVHDVDLRDVTADRMSPAIRALFERHSLLPLPEQHLNDREHLSIGRLFGPIEDRSNTRMDGEPRIYYGVSNETEDGGVDEEDNLRMLGSKANMLWHTDSTFLATPALANVLQARVVPDKAGLGALEPAVQQRLSGMTFHHRYSHSRARIDPDLAKPDLLPCGRARCRAGTKAVHVASHALAVSDMDEDEGRKLIDGLNERMTGPSHIHDHHWRPDNVLVRDERGATHRATPWPSDQARRLVSCCTSHGDADGLSVMRP